MSRIDRIRFAGIAPLPWANGGGSTRVLLDDGTPGVDWSYRISVADLSGAQPFSRFPGIDRHLTFLGPGELSMHVDGDAVALGRHDEIRFPGEADVSSAPSAPSARDLNVMVRRALCRAAVVRTEASTILRPDPYARASLWISLRPGGRLSDLDLAELDVAVLPPGGPVRAEGLGLFVEIHPRTP